MAERKFKMTRYRNREAELREKRMETRGKDGSGEAEESAKPRPILRFEVEDPDDPDSPIIAVRER